METERKYIRVKLAEHNLTQVWLIRELANKGIATDKTEMSSVLSGSRKGNKAESIILASVELLTNYDRLVN